MILSNRWRSLLGDEGGVQCGRVRSWKEMLEDPHVERRKLVAEVDDPLIGPTSVMNSPFRLRDAQAQVSGPAPMLGQHTYRGPSRASRLRPPGNFGYG